MPSFQPVQILRELFMGIVLITSVQPQQRRDIFNS
jgi:hypothetical protein